MWVCKPPFTGEQHCSFTLCRLLNQPTQYQTKYLSVMMKTKNLGMLKMVSCPQIIPWEIKNHSRDKTVYHQTLKLLFQRGHIMLFGVLPFLYCIMLYFLDVKGSAKWKSPCQRELLSPTGAVQFALPVFQYQNQGPWLPAVMALFLITLPCSA